jgi:hypothetical protein
MKSGFDRILGKNSRPTSRKRLPVGGAAFARSDQLLNFFKCSHRGAKEVVENSVNRVLFCF